MVHELRIVTLHVRLNDFLATLITNEANSTPSVSCYEEVSEPYPKTETKVQSRFIAHDLCAYT